MNEDEFYAPLPDRLQSERFLMSVIMDDGKRFLEVFDLINADDFSQEAFSHAWGWFRELTDKNKRITMYALNQAYGTHHSWEPFKSLVMGLNEGVMPMFFKDYARDVKAHADRANAQRAISRLNTAAMASAGFDEIADGIRDLFELTCAERASNGARKANLIVKDIEDMLANPITTPRYRTGLPSLDTMLKGGMRQGQLAIIAGRTGGGKTVLAMNIAVQIAGDGVPVVAFSLEMSDKDLIIRCILSETATMSEDAAKEKVRNLPLYVDETSNITARGIIAKIKLLKSRYGAKVFVVDYLQLLGTEANSRENRERIVADMSRRLKICAKEESVLVIALSQVNADGELRESKAVEQDADIVLHVVDVPETTFDPRGRKGERIETGEYDFFLRVTKHRGGEAHGPIGRAKAGNPGIPINFHKEISRFLE